MTNLNLSHPEELIHTYICTYKCATIILVRCKGILLKMIQTSAVDNNENNVF